MTKVIILAWWSWTRLWPISRKYYPKQFIKLKELDNLSLFQITLKRALLIDSKQNILIVTNENYKFHCINQAQDLGIQLDDSQLCIEPVAKNTLWAITFAISKLRKDEIWVVIPSDHIIWNDNIFAESIKNNLELAKKSLITFWIKPTGPHTWYGYISCQKSKLLPYKVNEFQEKPIISNAKLFVKKWYYWNAWIFMFSKQLYLRELKKYNKQYFEMFTKNTDIKEIFNTIPDISIDYWLLEKSKNIYMIPLNIYWNDLWSFDSFDEYLQNIWYTNNNQIQINANNNFVMTDNNKKIWIIWVNDLIIIDTKDSLLISKKWETQWIKKIVEILNNGWCTEAKYWLTVYRPWWSYTIIDEWVWFKTKRITVLNWKKLSSQMHYHRSEHWVVVSWTAIVTIWDNEIILKKWESVFIPAWTKHRLENRWKLPLHIIESQIWDYLEEDDIVRYDDDFWRK